MVHAQGWSPLSCQTKSVIRLQGLHLASMQTIKLLAVYVLYVGVPGVSLLMDVMHAIE